MAYPTWASFKALETPGRDDDTQWLTYWIIYAFFRAFEIFADVFIGWFPFYHSFKLILLVMLQLPQLQIPKYIYVTFVRPLMKQKEKEVDEIVGNAFSSVKDSAIHAIKDGATIISGKYTEHAINNALKWDKDLKINM